MKEPVKLGPIQETLLIPLLGRAAETKRSRGLLTDHRAVEIVDSLDYDFAKWRNTPSLAAASLRTLLYDRLVQRFLAKNPGGTVLEIGCGLNTRFDRVDNGSVRWFDLDLPDVMTLRRRYFEDQERCTMISASILEDGWIDEVQATGGPWLFVSEAVLIYLDEADVRQAVTRLAEAFDSVWLIMDTTSRAMVATQDKHDAMRHMSKESWFRWGCDNPAVVESWVPGLQLQESLTIADVPADIFPRLPWKFRFGLKLMPSFYRKRVDGYRINLYS
ncbi:MAG: class I SAM-dependent methyltransferase [Pseudomonadota bacterium]